MAQVGYTPIQLYYSTTASAVPSAGNLTDGELAINTADGIIFYKTPGGSVVPIANATSTSYLTGLTGNVQTQINNLQSQINTKGEIGGQTWTGTHVFPSTTSIGNVSSTELSYLDGVTSSIQTQFGTKGSISGQSWTGVHDFTAASVKISAPSAPDSPVTKYYADGLAFATALPAQAGNAGKTIITDGTTASWGLISTATVTDFTSSGTYTVPTDAKFVEVHAYGAGGGGGSGARGAAASVRNGGGGGGGGALVIRRFKVSEITSTVSVTVGAGGTGGAAVTADSTSGSSGSNGGNSTFGSYVTSYGGAGGTGGSSSATNGGGGGGVSSAGSTSAGGAPLIAAASNTVQQFGGGSGSTSSTANKNSVYGGGGGGYADAALANISAGASVYSAGGGACGAGINASNIYKPPSSNGATNYVTNSNTTSQSSVNGANGGSFEGGFGGAVVVPVSSLSYTAIAYGGSKFIGVANNDGNYYFSESANGTTGWDAKVFSVPTFQPTGVFHDGSKWVFYSTTQIYTSSDLINFTAATRPFPSTSTNQIYYAGGLYVAVGQVGSIATSTDLNTWTSRTSGTSQGLNAVIHNGTKWIVVGSTGVTLTSSDAITWTLVTVSGTPGFFSVAANGAVLVAHSNAIPYAHYSTDTGATWTAVATTLGLPSAGGGNKTLLYAGGRFVLISTSILWTSTDGNTWTLQTDGTSDNYSGIAYDGTTYVVGSTTVNGNLGITSTDAVTWTARTFTDSRTPLAGNGGSGGMCAGGGGGAGQVNGYNSGAGGAGGNGFVRVFSW